MNNRPLIKLFKTHNKSYMYDANKNIILNITSKQYSLLQEYMKKNIYEYKEKELQDLYNRGFLSNNKVEEIVHPDDELISFYLDNSIKMLTLQVTQQCNFRCEYCAYSGSYLNRSHSCKRMSLSTALKGIDFLISHSKNNDKVCIAFYGGEPLLEFNLIKKCVKYALEKIEGKEIHFTMTTNGSLLNDEIIEFLYKNNVALTISLDGPEEIQDSHRKFALNNEGSYKKVMENIVNLKEKFPEYLNKVTFNTVVDPQNDFKAIDDFFLNNNVVKDIRMTSTLISNNNRKSSLLVKEDFYVKQEYELFRIFYYLIKKNNTKKCSRIMLNSFNDILSFPKELKPQKMLDKKNHPSGACTPGVHRLFLNAEGNFYPCERVSECSEIMRIGDIENGLNVEKARKILNLGKINEESCKNCWAIKLCTICAAALESNGNEFSKKQKELCCSRVKSVIEQKFKNYCCLKEFGYNFKESEPSVKFEN